MTDAQLLKAHLSGDGAAFGRLVERYFALVHGVATRQCLGQADDVTQAVFLLLAQKAQRLRGRENLAGWLFTTTRLCARTARRSEGRRRKYEAEASAMRSEIKTTDADLKMTETGNLLPLLPLLDSAIAALPASDRAVVLLHHLQNQPLADVAQTLELSVPAASKRGQRAVEKLRRWFARKGHDVPAASMAMLLMGGAGKTGIGLMAGGGAGVGTGITGATPVTPQVAALTKATHAAMVGGKVKMAVASAAAVALAAGVGVIALRGPARPAAATAAVSRAPEAAVADTQSAGAVTTAPAVADFLPKTAIFTGQQTTKEEGRELMRIYFERPASFRAEYLLADGSVDPQKPAEVVNGGKAVHADERSKLYAVEESTGAEVSQMTAILLFAGLAPPAAGSQAARETALGNQPKVNVIFEPRDLPAGSKPGMRRFEILAKTATGALRLFGPDNRLFLTYNAQDICCRIETAGTALQASMDLQLNAPLPAGIFELKGPPGYTDVREGILPRLAPEVRAIADKYYAAREGITRYRMLLLEGRYPRYRNVRDGEQWRLDALQFDFLMRDRDLFELKDAAALDEGAFMDMVLNPDLPLDHLVMTYQGQLAQVGYNYSTDDGGAKRRSDWLVPPILVMSSTPEEDAKQHAARLKIQWYKQAPRALVGSVADYDLRQLGWPAFKGDVLVAPHGWDLGTPPPVYYRLAPRADHPELVGLRAVEGNSDEAVDYWIDPGHDYLCVDYMEYYDRDTPWKADPSGWNGQRNYAGNAAAHSPHPWGRSITEFARTAAGQWYPKRLQSTALGEERVLLDTPATINQKMFAWPADAPEPGGLVKPVEERKKAEGP